MIPPSQLMQYSTLAAICLTAMALLGRVGIGQEILVLDGGGSLYSVDPSSGHSAAIGSTGHHTLYWTGLSQDSQGRLFSAYGDDWLGYGIYEVNPTDGNASRVTDTVFTGIGSMAFGPGDVLYIVNDPIWPLYGGTYDLFSLDLNTGVETFIGNTGMTNLLALDFRGGDLYGFEIPLGLVKIDISTGIATDVNANFRGPIGVTASMCFDDNGALYYIDHALWMMDKGSGIYNPVT